MNNHLINKKKRYEQISAGECFKNNLKGLATIELNITEMCSRMCSFCPRHDPKVYKNQNLQMSLETAKILAQECKKERYIGDITIAGFGEPMLNPNLSEIISTLREYLTNHITVITNGDFLDEKSLKKLIDSGLNKVLVSCYDGPYEWDKFVDLLSQFPTIESDIKELWIDQNTSLEQLVKSNNFNTRTGLVPIPEFEKGKQCYIPFYKLLIDWNGDILLCSNDWHRKEQGFGNINVTPLKNIWLGEKMSEIRKNLAIGNRCGKACKDCNVKGTLIGKESFDLFN